MPALFQLAAAQLAVPLGGRRCPTGRRARIAVGLALVVLDLGLVAIPAGWALPVPTPAVVLASLAFLVVVGLAAVHSALRRTPAPIRRALLLTSRQPGSGVVSVALAKLADAGLVTRSAALDDSTAAADALRTFRPDLLLVDDAVADRLPELLAEVADLSTVTVLRVPAAAAVRPSLPTLDLADALPVGAA